MSLSENLSGLAQTAMTTLPPAFVMLAAINVAFLGAVLWFVESHSAERFQLVDKIVSSCLLAKHGTGTP